MSDEKPDPKALNTEDEQQVRAWAAQLRQAETDVSVDVAAKLAAARRNAVAAAEQTQPAGISWVRWGGFATAAAVVLALAIFLRAPVQQLPVAEDLELAVAAEVELMEELEFVAWMVAMEDGDAAPTSG